MSSQIACDMSALSDAQHDRHQQVAQQIFALKQSVRELPDGFALQYADEPQIYLLIAEFISLEHRCCPFFRLALEVEPEQQAIWLKIGGSAEIKDFVRAEMFS